MKIRTLEQMRKEFESWVLRGDEYWQWKAVRKPMRAKKRRK